MKNLVRDQRGTVAIEAAILMPIMLACVGLACDAGLGLLSKSTLTYATQQAAVATARGIPEGSVQSMFLANLAGPMSGATLTCTSGTIVVCDASASHSFFFAGLFGVPSEHPLTAHAEAGA